VKLPAQSPVTDYKYRTSATPSHTSISTNLFVPLLCVLAQVMASTQDLLACYNHTSSVDAHWVVNLSLGGPGTVTDNALDGETLKQTICDKGGELLQRFWKLAGTKPHL
jgi:hypothetical protein